MWLLFRNRAWLLTFFIASVPLYAEQRKYVVGTTLNLTAGAANGLTSAIIAPNQPLFFSYGAFPTSQWLLLAPVPWSTLHTLTVLTAASHSRAISSTPTRH